MIEITIKYIDGVQFLDTFKIVSWEKVDGVNAQLVSRKLINQSYTNHIIRTLGLVKVGYDASMRADIFVKKYGLSRLYLKLSKVYWRLVRFMYDNCRLFKQIPLGSEFSWRYFTPYTWIKKHGK